MFSKTLGRWFRLSLSVQLMLATLLAILPLVAAVAYAAVSLSQQTRVQQQRVLSMAALNHLDASVSEQLKGLERSARQYRLLREPQLHDRYRQRLEQLQGSYRRLAAMPGLDREAVILADLVRIMESVGEQLPAPAGTDAGLEDLQPELQQAYQRSGELSEHISAHLQTSLTAGEEQFDTVLRHLLLIGVLAIPGTVLLVAIGSLAIAKPIGRLERAIRDLGHRRWQEPVVINGPADLLDLGERLDWMRRKLLASENQSQALLQHITHELKNPLAAITEAGALLADGVTGDLTAGQQRVLEILQDNAENLHDLIQQLLAYNSVNHRDGMGLEAVELRAHCLKQLAKFAAIGPHQDVRWVLGERSLTVLADPLALEMIITNLFSNAVHYSPPGGEITVDWGLGQDGWWLTVADRGPGIPEAEHQRIFRPFVRGSAPRRGAVKGSGVGLAIVEECVKGMGGSIRVESQPGSGSCFRVECPVANRREPGR